jgi:hypothetical protein
MLLNIIKMSYPSLAEVIRQQNEPGFEIRLQTALVQANLEEAANLTPPTPPLPVSAEEQAAFIQYDQQLDNGEPLWYNFSLSNHGQ